MNNTELTLDQLSEVAGGRWADIRDHNYGKFMQTRRFNRKPNIWTSGGTTSVWTTGPVTSFQKDVVKNFMLEVPMC
ncbi:CCRG-2 family RiPP [Prochlorococcus marinus]|uniref:CCRG-2 family RiPP n=1 Tax=Prochlorococcus marinus TaxID=1219 RepID=UPI0022B4CA33|nr:CCRG-2 family RiPP [Prochlorococcus marinus]